jgi:hypothetical protein
MKEIEELMENIPCEVKVTRIASFAADFELKQFRVAHRPQLGK